MMNKIKRVGRFSYILHIAYKAYREDGTQESGGSVFLNWGNKTIKESQYRTIQKAIFEEYKEQHKKNGVKAEAVHIAIESWQLSSK